MRRVPAIHDHAWQSWDWENFYRACKGRSSGVPLITASFAIWQGRGHLGDMLRAMQDSFAEANASAPCILFIDEIDAAGSRESVERQNSNYRRQVINGFIEQVDLAIQAEGVLTIGTCNGVAARDPAILRPGRFDSLVEVPLPSRAALTTMLHQQLQGAGLADLVTAAIRTTSAAIDAAIRGARGQARLGGHKVQSHDIIARLAGSKAPDRALMWRIAIHECVWFATQICSD